jgi:acyl-CoA synthetase (NDP forming)
MSGGGGKPVLVCWMGEADTNAPLTLESETIPRYAFPETAAAVLSKAATYAEWRRQPVGVIPDFKEVDFSAVRKIALAGLEAGRSGWLTAEETRAVLTAMQLPILPGGVARTAEAAVTLAEQIGFPVAVKLTSRSILHKTEVGGVQLDLDDPAAVRRAFAQIRERLAARQALDAMDGVVVQPMVSCGVELMVGVTHDPLFGPILAFGLGGIHVEILKDVCFRITPLTDRDAAEMVRGIKGYQLLEGYRGHPPADLEAVQDVLLRVSRLVEEVPEIAELDLNPVFALTPGQGCRIVDARIRIGEHSA